MPDSSSQEYDEDEEEPESEEELADATSHSDEEEVEEELCSLAGSPRGCYDAENPVKDLQIVEGAGTSLRKRITNKARGQCQETFVPGNPSMPARPMMEQEAGSNVWYQAYVLRESMNEVKVRFPPYDSEDEERVEWVRKSSSRIWRGSYRNSQWKHLGRGAWAPKSQPKRGRRRPTSSKQTRKRTSSRLHTTDTSADGDTGATGALADDLDVAGTAIVSTCPVASHAKCSYSEGVRSRVAPHSRDNKAKRSKSSDNPVTEEHSERGPIEHRGSRECHSGALDTSNKENCDRTSAKSNPSEYKGIFSCSEPEDQDPECSVDHAEYDPLTKWFEVHFEQLQLHGKIPRFFPHGTPEAGVLPPGFQWQSNGVAFTEAGLAAHASEAAKLKVDAAAGAPAAQAQEKRREQVKVEPCLQEATTKHEVAERGAKLRKVNDGSCADSRSLLRTEDLSLNKRDTQPFKQVQQLHVDTLDLCTAELVPPSPVMSPTTSTGGAAVITSEGNVVLKLPIQSPSTASPHHQPSPSTKDRKPQLDMPPGGSSQSESDILHEKDQPRTTSMPHPSSRVPQTAGQKHRDGFGGSLPGRVRSQPVSISHTKLKRKRAVIVSDDEDDDVALVTNTTTGSNAHHWAGDPSTKTSPSSCMPSNAQPCASPRTAAGPSAGVKPPLTHKSDGRPRMNSSSVPRVLDKKVLSSSGKVLPKSASMTNTAARQIPRKPPVSGAGNGSRPLSGHAGRPEAPLFHRQTPAARSASTVLKPSLASNSRSQGISTAKDGKLLQAAAILVDDCPTITCKTPSMPSMERMLPHKKALLSGKPSYGSR